MTGVCVLMTELSADAAAQGGQTGRPGRERWSLSAVPAGDRDTSIKVNRNVCATYGVASDLRG